MFWSHLLLFVLLFVLKDSECLEFITIKEDEAGNVIKEVFKIKREDIRPTTFSNFDTANRSVSTNNNIIDKSKIDFECLVDDNFGIKQNPSINPIIYLDRENIIELLVVLDKEHGDVFNHDRNAIINYILVYFWEVNNIYKSFKIAKINIKIKAIVNIQTFSGQPFIEEARAEDGRAEFGRILGRFTDYANANFDKYDIYSLITNTNLEWYGGLAYIGSVCQGHATSVWSDWANWGSIGLAAHELGHNIGLYHEANNNMGCGPVYNDPWYFSICEDKVASELINQPSKNCLREETHEDLVDLDDALLDQNAFCQLVKRNPNAYVFEEDRFNCGHNSMRCAWLESGEVHTSWHTPAENSPCGDNGRCFRKKCRNVPQLIKNRSSGLCMVIHEPNQFDADVKMFPCKRTQYTDIYKSFSIRNETVGSLLTAPYWIYPVYGDRCIFNKKQGELSAAICDANNPNQGYEVVSVGNDYIMIKHKISGKCAKPRNQSAGSYVEGANCNSNDENFHWKLIN